MQIDRFPRPGAKIDALRTIIQGGGPIPTAMVALARFGYKPSLIAKVGADPFGDFVIEELRRENVDTSFIKISSKSTAIACGWIEKGPGSRTIALDLQLEIKASEINLKKLPKTKFIHLDGRNMPACLKLARWGRRQGIPVMLDVGSMRNDVGELIPLMDHLVCAREFALPYTKSRTIRKAIDRLRDICQGTVVVTSGLKGSWGADPEGSVIHQKAYRVKTVDTTGAGDTYHGAYIAGILKGYTLQKRMEIASAAAALKCSEMGGRTAIPNMKKVTKFLRSRGKS